ncbi:ComF family protein [Proteiniclasticum sp. C24MP]|uniref:ComF family protein n=1 Tax=Proteiniclasticum sp. C24MP TaxID=3374101 RepID=UPI00375427A3
MNRIADFFYPKLKCPVCKVFSEGLCIPCGSSFHFLEEGKLSDSEMGISLYRHQEAVKILVSSFKKKMLFSAGDIMVSRFVEQISSEKEIYDFITYAPSSKSSVKRLGFDHGAYLAKRIGKKLHTPVAALFHPPDKEQKVLEREERCENAKKISLISMNVRSLKGKKGLVVDDVYTTGSTVTACLELMKKEGMEGKYITFSRIP